MRRSTHHPKKKIARTLRTGIDTTVISYSEHAVLPLLIPFTSVERKQGYANVILFVLGRGIFCALSACDLLSGIDYAKPVSVHKIGLLGFCGDHFFKRDYHAPH